MHHTKILVVFTGGTIGSAPEEGYLAPGGEAPRKRLIEQFTAKKQCFYEEKHETKIEFESIAPYEILSENLKGEYLECLYDALKEQMEKEMYQGVIVTVGTDTLAYSSAALGYLFADTKIPIVTVSANYTLTDERSNGYVNFEQAVHLILEGCHVGVFCSYHNQRTHYFHYATRLLQQVNYSDQVYSVLNTYYAYVKEDSGEIVLNESLECPRTCLANKTLEVNHGLRIMKDTLVHSHVAFLRPYPGMLYPKLNEVDAVLLDTYHSGTFPVKGSGFDEFLKEARELEIPVFVAGVPEGLTYESTKAYETEKAYVLPQASPIAMYIKLWFLLATHRDVRKEMFLPIGMDIVSKN